MQSNQSHTEVKEVWCSGTMIHINNISYKDMRENECRYDHLRYGYWIKVPSPTATMLALKGCIFGPKYDENVWFKDKEW
jgi:hypothetical protein